MLRTTQILLMALMLLAGCETTSSNLEGKYVAERQDGKAVTLTLKPGFTGEWETSTDAVTVRWEVKDEEIWLHAKSGGLLRGRIDGHTLHVELPGEEVFVFKRK